jgi:hypothetical protein
MEKFQQSAPSGSQMLDSVPLEARSKTVNDIQENLLFARMELAFEGRLGKLAMGTGRTIGYHPEQFLLGRVSPIKNRDGNGR